MENVSLLCKESFFSTERLQLVWLQDVPPRPTAIDHDPKNAAKLDDFPSVLQRTLHAIGVKDVLDNLRGTLPITAIEDLRCRWDWSNVKVQLVPSIAGKHTGTRLYIPSSFSCFSPSLGLNTINAFGHTRLMKAVRNLGMTRKPGTLVLECLVGILTLLVTPTDNLYSRAHPSVVMARPG